MADAHRADPDPVSGQFSAGEVICRPLETLSLAISGFGGDRTLGIVLRDWFDFLGGRPGEIVYVDGGSGEGSVRALARLLRRGWIDRLELLNPAHWENDFNRCYIQEYRAGAVATLPHICFIKLDMLPFRRAHTDWLAQDLSLLQRPEVFAITNTHLLEPPSREHQGRYPGYHAYDFASLNFSLMRRDRFHAAMQEQIGGLIASNFRGPYPEHLQPDPRWRRALVEWAWQAHCRQNRFITLARPESPDWTIYHINKRGRKLLEYRRRYRARDGVSPFFDQPKALYRPPLRSWQRWGRGVEAAFRSLRRGG